MLKQIVIDPHHGNIFVRKLNNSKSAEIVLIDRNINFVIKKLKLKYFKENVKFIKDGLYDYINEKDRKNLCKLWKYIILKDDEKMKYFSTQLNVKGICEIEFLFTVSLMRLSFKFFINKI